MNKDKTVPFTLEEEKKLAKTRLIFKFSVLFLMFGFFGGFAGFVLSLIGLIKIDEIPVLLYIGAPLFVVGIILCIIAFKGRYLNKKIYEKMLYRLLADNFGENKYEKLTHDKIMKNFLTENEVINVSVEIVRPDNYRYRLGNSDIKLINVQRGASLETNKAFINEMFTVSNQAVLGEKKLDLDLDFKGLAVVIENTNINLFNPIDIRDKSSDVSHSMIYLKENIVDKKDDFTSKFDVYLKNERFYELISDNLKRDLLKLKEKNLKIVLLIKESKAFLLVKDVYVAPIDLLKRDDEKIYEKFSKYSAIYFAINKVIDDLIKKYEEE